MAIINPEHLFDQAERLMASAAGALVKPICEELSQHRIMEFFTLSRLPLQISSSELLEGPLQSTDWHIALLSTAL